MCSVLFIATWYDLTSDWRCVVDVLADAILRGCLYLHFAELLSGLTTIRAYGEVDQFKCENHELVDIENRSVTLYLLFQLVAHQGVQSLLVDGGQSGWYSWFAKGYMFTGWFCSDGLAYILIFLESSSLSLQLY